MYNGDRQDNKATIKSIQTLEKHSSGKSNCMDLDGLKVVEK